MSEVRTLTKSIVADYCSYCNRHQEKTMPETVFLFCHHCKNKTAQLVITQTIPAERLLQALLPHRKGAVFL